MIRAGLVVLLWASPAAAQITFDLRERSGDRLPAEGVNRADCEEEEVWSFTYSCLVCTNVAFWVGDNCNVAENRNGASPTCRELRPMEGPSAVLQDLDVYSGELVDPFDPTHLECPETTGTSSVFLLDLLDASDDATAFAEYSIGIDTDPPPAPTEVVVEAGEGNVTVEWTADADSSDDRDAFQVLCDVATGGGGDAGPDAGAGGCGSFPSDLAAMEELFCEDRQGATARSLRVDDLQNGTEYAFAVIAYDSYENPSEPSEVACTSPAPVRDFYEAYRDAGGKAGGGLCAAGPGRTSPVGPGLFALAFLALARRR